MPIFTKAAANFIKRADVKTFLLAMTLASFAGPCHADWDVDFSRRVEKKRETELNAAAPREPASVVTPPDHSAATADAGAEESKKGVFDTIFDSGEPVQDVVILQTDHGFVPATVRVRKNGRYRVSIVNVNEKEKNVSFILEAFSEHDATYYGKIKTFILEPKKEGSFSFQSPETSAEGKIIVFNPELSLRAPANEGGSN